LKSIYKLKDLFDTESIRGQLVKGTLFTLIIRVTSTGLLFLVTTLLARLLGAANYGAYANSMAWINVFVIFASFGFGTLLVRDVAILRTNQRLATLKGILKFSNTFVIIGSSFLVLILVILSKWIFSSNEDELLKDSLIISSFLVPIFALSGLRRSALRGLEKISLALLPEMILRPILLLVGIGILYYNNSNLLKVPIIIGINIFGGIITLLLGNYWLNKNLPTEIKNVKPDHKINYWLKSAFPLLVYGGLQIILAQTSTIILGAQGSAQNVGFYSVANRLAYLLTFFLGAIHMIIAPIMARMYSKGEKEGLQKIITISVWISFIISLILGIIFGLAGKRILGIFGPEYSAANLVLLILVFGNLLDIAFGNSALLLSMTGNEKVVAKIFFIISVINIPLNFYMIKLYSIEGAALSTSFSLIVGRFLLALYSKRKLEINTSIFASLR
jgi:O-antigen/teichoic acid export membrane protein